MSNGIYDILGKLAALTPKEEPKQEQPQKVYESVEARGSILEGIEKKLAEDYASMGIGSGSQGGVVGEVAENPYQQRILDSDPEALDEFLKTGYLDTTSELYNQMYDYYANQMPASVRRNEDKQYDFITAKIREVAGVNEDPQQAYESAAPGQEGWIKKNKQRFIDQYGKDKGLEVLYATAWKRSKQDESAEVCADCGMNEAECTCVHEASDYGWDNPEEKKPAVRKITGKYGTEYQGDPEDDEAGNGVGSASSGKKGRGRPRKHAIKPPKTDGNGNKLGRGRPKKAASTFAPGSLAAALGMGAAPKKHSKGRVHRMNESRMLDEAGEALQHILNRFKAEVKAFEQGAEIDENLYDALYDYYVDLGEMPYGVQKARTGDPYNWVTQRLESELNITAESIDAEGVEECGATTAGAVAVAPERSLEEEMADLVELAKLAGIETEGNAFTDKLKSTPKGSEFELNGEVYTDTSNLDEADVEVSEPTEEPVNAPKKKYFSMRSSTMNPGEGDFGEKTMNPDRPTKNNGDNALSRPPVRESSLDLESKLAAEYESIKKISK